MRVILKYSFILFISFFLQTCKKKTNIEVTLFNHDLNEYVKNAKIALVEKKGDAGGGVLAGNASCKEIAIVTTDNNGRAYFDKEKLKTREGFKYFCAVTESWGVQQSYSCSGKTSGFLEIGKTQEIALFDFAETFFHIQYNNLFNPAISGDSLSYKIYKPQDSNAGNPVVLTYDIMFPVPSIYFSQTVTINAAKFVVELRKRKMGVVIMSIDTIRAYPPNSVLQINW